MNRECSTTSLRRNWINRCATHIWVTVPRASPEVCLEVATALWLEEEESDPVRAAHLEVGRWTNAVTTRRAT